jgi:hypothetical protein
VVPPLNPTTPAREVDEMAKLREALAKAEAQISQLKLEKAIGKGPGDGHEFHSRPLAPNMMPGIPISK